MNSVKNNENFFFIKTLSYAEQKVFCICVDVYKIYEVNVYDKIYNILSTLKGKKLNINNVLIEKYEDLLKKILVLNTTIIQKLQLAFIKLHMILSD